MEHKWDKSEVKHGIQTVTVRSWPDFSEFISQELKHNPRYVYRGHRCDDWLLEPTLNRLIRKAGHLRDLEGSDLKEQIECHYRNFRYAVRGRRGNNAPQLKGDYLWALGQHYGLATPLLDWTTSPFLAAFFAFDDEGEPQTDHRTVYAVIKDDLTKRCKGGTINEPISFFTPFSDENPRLVNQGGLFSRLPYKLDLEGWLLKYWEKESSDSVLIKIRIPNMHRCGVLRSLASMNIAHHTVFPDLSGSALFCNTALKDRQYATDLGDHPSPYQRIVKS